MNRYLRWSLAVSAGGVLIGAIAIAVTAAAQEPSGWNRVVVIWAVATATLLTIARQAVATLPETDPISVAVVNRLVDAERRLEAYDTACEAWFQAADPAARLDAEQGLYQAWVGEPPPVAGASEVG